MPPDSDQSATTTERPYPSVWDNPPSHTDDRPDVTEAPVELDDPTAVSERAPLVRFTGSAGATEYDHLLTVARRAVSDDSELRDEQVDIYIPREFPPSWALEYLRITARDGIDYIAMTVLMQRAMGAEHYAAFVQADPSDATWRRVNAIVTNRALRPLRTGKGDEN